MHCSYGLKILIVGGEMSCWTFKNSNKEYYSILNDILSLYIKPNYFQKNYKSSLMKFTGLKFFSINEHGQWMRLYCSQWG